MILSCSLAIFLALEASPSRPGPDACRFGDNRCKAEHFLERARTATSPRDRALYIFSAHRLYLALFDDSGSDPDLCAARRAFDRALAVKGQESAQRGKYETQRVDLTRREGPRGERCGRRRAAKSESPRVVEAPPGSKSPGPSSAAVASDRASATPPTVSLITDPVQATSTTDLLPVVARTSPAPRRFPAVPHQDRIPEAARPGRRLVMAGGVTLGVGLGMTAVAGVMGGHLLGTWRDGRDLQDSLDGHGTTGQTTRDAELRGEYQRLRGPTLAMAFVGGSTLVVGAVLVVISAKRLARVTARTAILPMPGGLVFRARF